MKKNHQSSSELFSYLLLRRYMIHKGKWIACIYFSLGNTNHRVQRLLCLSIFYIATPAISILWQIFMIYLQLLWIYSKGTYLKAEGHSRQLLDFRNVGFLHTSVPKLHISCTYGCSGNKSDKKMWHTEADRLLFYNM